MTLMKEEKLKLFFMAVKINTSIPGPKSRLLTERKSKSVARGHGTVCDVYILNKNVRTFMFLLSIETQARL